MARLNEFAEYTTPRLPQKLHFRSKLWGEIRWTWQNAIASLPSKKLTTLEQATLIELETSSAGKICG
jgi:hypothetical protein